MTVFQRVCLHFRFPAVREPLFVKFNFKDLTITKSQTYCSISDTFSVQTNSRTWKGLCFQICCFVDTEGLLEFNQSKDLAFEKRRRNELAPTCLEWCLVCGFYHKQYAAIKKSKKCTELIHDRSATESLNRAFI